MIESTIDTAIVMIAWSPNGYRMKIMRQSFASLKAHTHRDHLLVVVDNGPIEQTDFLNDQSIDVHIVNPVNLGVGKSRNAGAAAAASSIDYIAFVDNDLGYFDGWLNACIETLEKYPDEKLIASPVKNKPMRLHKYDRGMLDEYTLHARCAGMAMVMRRTDYIAIGRFNERKSNVGHQFCAAAKKHGYRFIHHPDWTGRHIAKVPSYHYKKQQFDPVTGLWLAKKPKSILQESNV